MFKINCKTRIDRVTLKQSIICSSNDIIIDKNASNFGSIKCILTITLFRALKENIEL